MQNFFLESDIDSPKIELEKDNGIFRFTGFSFPENTELFYNPIIIWFENYFKAPNVYTLIEFNLEYFNTSTSKVFMHLFNLFSKHYNKGIDIQINWFYFDEDEDIQESGINYKMLNSVPFNLIPYSIDYIDRKDEVYNTSLLRGVLV